MDIEELHCLNKGIWPHLTTGDSMELGPFLQPIIDFYTRLFLWEFVAIHFVEHL